MPPSVSNAFDTKYNFISAGITSFRSSIRLLYPTRLPNMPSLNSQQAAAQTSRSRRASGHSRSTDTTASASLQAPVTGSSTPTSEAEFQRGFDHLVSLMSFTRSTIRSNADARVAGGEQNPVHDSAMSDFTSLASSEGVVPSSLHSPLRDESLNSKSADAQGEVTIYNLPLDHGTLESTFVALQRALRAYNPRTSLQALLGSCRPEDLRALGTLLGLDKKAWEDNLDAVCGSSKEACAALEDPESRAKIARLVHAQFTKRASDHNEGQQMGHGHDKDAQVERGWTVPQKLQLASGIVRIVSGLLLLALALYFVKMMRRPLRRHPHRSRVEEEDANGEELSDLPPQHAPARTGV